ncbi:MAG: PASTA domain-containing protein [Desulfobulbus sp.]
MVKTARSKKNRRRWFFPFLVILLAAAGAILYRCPLSLQDIGRILQSAAGKISSFSAGQAPAEPVLRGTIYDRNFSELAVSYKLYSVYANPVEVGDRRRVAQALEPLVEVKAEKLQARLKSSQYSIMLTTDLDEQQAERINALHLQGISCKANEVRFYPGHTAASHVLGFMGDGVGLAGVEGKYDTVLQGVFRKNNIPDIDFQGREHLGDTGADLVLTLDIGLQKMLESRFRDFLAASGTEKGMGLLIEPGSGRILALMNQPSFNPNYFWKANETNRVNRIYNHLLDKEMIRPILARAAAIEREGLDGPGLLPPTVAAPDYGFSDQQLEGFEQQIELYGSVFGNWESGPTVKERRDHQPVVTGVQVGVTLASLVNGGWRITPYVVDSLYDHATATRYHRNPEATERSHVLDPALGVKIRRELFANWASDQENGVVFTGSRLDVEPDGPFSEYSMQDLFIALTPATRPKYLLLIATEQDHLLPDPPQKKNGGGSLEALGRDLLAALARQGEPATIAGVPSAKSEENRRQFFISKQLNFKNAPEKNDEPAAVMPQMRGMSLRKALQQIDPLNLRVRINGTGRIVAQYPLAGQPLTGIEECIVTLESR